MAGDSRLGFLQALKSYRQALTPAQRAHSRHPRPIQWQYPWALEKRYASNLTSIFKPLVNFVNDYWKQHGEAILRGDSEEFRMDETTGPGWHGMLSSLEGWVAQYFGDESGKTAPAHIMMGLGKSADDTKAFVMKNWNKATNSVMGISFDTSAEWWPAMRQAWIDSNFKLIRGAAKRYVDQVSRLSEKAVVNGWSSKSLTHDFMGLGDGMTHSYARLLARDQTGKLNGHITQGEQTDAGLETYTWRTAGDERVRGDPSGKYPKSVPSHFVMDGLLCRWDDATVYSDDNGATWQDRTADMPMEHPGGEIQCRCTALSNFDELIGNVDKSLGDDVPDEEEGQSEEQPEDNPEENPGEEPGPEEFTPASTTKGAEQWAIDHDIADVVLWGKLPMAVANAANEALWNTYSEFPELRQSIKQVGSNQSMRRWYIEQRTPEIAEKYKRLNLGVSYTDEQWMKLARQTAAKEIGKTTANNWALSYSGKKLNGIAINEIACKNPELMKASLDHDVATSFHPVGCNSVKSIVDHEIGHRLDAHLGITRDRSFAELKTEIYKDKPSNMTELDFLKANLSRYAYSNDKELLAEAWSEFRNNPAPRPIATKIGTFILKKLQEAK